MLGSLRLIVLLHPVGMFLCMTGKDSFFLDLFPLSLYHPSFVLAFTTTARVFSQLFYLDLARFLYTLLVFFRCVYVGTHFPLLSRERCVLKQRFYCICS